MSKFPGGRWTAPAFVLALVLAGPAVPVLAQTAPENVAELRLRKIEAEVRAIQRQVFPGGDGKFFTPEMTQAPTPLASGSAAPSSTPVTDMLSRMDALESQVARLTSQSEINANRLSKIEARLTVLEPAPASSSPASSPSGGEVAAANVNLAAMTGGASAAKPAAAPAAAAPNPAPKGAAPAPAAANGPSAQRLAAVRAIVKPQTSDPGDDEYSYGFRLYDARFLPEAQQQLKLFLDKYPRHSRVSFARNLLGRAYLDDAKPRDAATWFLQNYQNDKTGPRAPDSLLFLAESMSRLKDTSRACIALAEFTDGFPAEAAGRLKAQYDATRATVKCN